MTYLVSTPFHADIFLNGEFEISGVEITPSTHTQSYTQALTAYPTPFFFLGGGLSHFFPIKMTEKDELKQLKPE